MNVIGRRSVSSNRAESGCSPRRTRRVANLVLATTLATAATAGYASSASASSTVIPCTARTSSTVFAPWLDPASYFRATNGGFEQGAANWTLSGSASVATGNEPFHVGGSTDTHSLRLGAGGSALSQTACVTLGEPTLRLFVKAPAVLGATLQITTTVADPTTGLTLQTQYAVLAGLTPSAWAPTPEILLPNLLGGVLPENLTVKITAGGTRATWSVDDVYVDPFKSH